MNSTTLLMYGYVSWGKVYSAHIFYNLDWTLTSISSFYRRYFRNYLLMSPDLYGTISLWKVCMWSFGEHISKQVDSAWWSCRLSSQIPWFVSSGFFFSGVPWRALCTTCQSILKWTWWHESPLLLLQFMKCIVFSNMSVNPCRVSVMHAFRWPQFQTHAVMLLCHTFYLFIYLVYVCGCNKAFYSVFCVMALLFFWLFIKLGLHVHLHAFWCNYGSSQCSLPSLQVYTWHSGIHVDFICFVSSFQEMFEIK